jgi:hypothetical protein
MKRNALTMALSSHLVKSGLRQVEHPTATEPNASKRVRKTISLSTGFRKHVISTFIEAGLSHEIRELIVDHSTQLDQHYFRPSQEEEFVEIVVNVLDREEGVDRDIALLIADGVYNRLKSSNIRECVRIARLARNDITQINLIVDMFARYATNNGPLR